MDTKLARIAELAKRRPKIKLQTLAHAIDAETLIACHREMKEGKATGIDKETKEHYEEKLQENVAELIARMKRQAYKPQPVKRVYIPKDDGKKQRPLGIPAYEDKLVQAALSKILNAIYENEFLGFSYGFRPGRSCHDAIRALGRLIECKRVNYVVDADIKAFFDNVDHEWLIRMMKERIGDANILRLITRFLKAGVVEQGKYNQIDLGTPQGGPLSPILGNIYLHYVLDLWFVKETINKSKGEAYIIRYADDFICCFEHKEDAEKFYGALRERMGKFGLELSEEKTKIIQFGRNAEEERNQEGMGKPKTFDFLGFTHYCSKSKKGNFRVKRKTSRKKFKAKLKKCKAWLHENMHKPLNVLIKKLNKKLIGHYNYYGITDNYSKISSFFYHVKGMLVKALGKRSQRRKFTWEKFNRLEKKYPLVRPKIKVKICF